MPCTLRVLIAPGSSKFKTTRASSNGNAGESRAGGGLRRFAPLRDGSADGVNCAGGGTYRFAATARADVNCAAPRRLSVAVSRPATPPCSLSEYIIFGMLLSARFILGMPATTRFIFGEPLSARII
jgi:hypothetical protein